MYYIYKEKELATGLVFAAISNRPWTARPGLSLLETLEFSTHSSAVHAMLSIRSKLRKQNSALIPGYIPPSKRKVV